MMAWLILAKVAFWMILIGAVALITPVPAWDAFWAKSLLFAGLALVVALVVFRLWQKRGTPGQRE